MPGARMEDEGGGTPLPASDGERQGLTHENKTVLNRRRHGRVRSEFNETETGPRVPRTKVVMQRKYKPKVGSGCRPMICPVPPHTVCRALCLPTAE